MHATIKFLDRLVGEFTRWHLATPLVGYVRTLLASTLILTLAFNKPGWLFETGKPVYGTSSPPLDWTNFFSFMRLIHPYAPNVGGILLLLVVASGWRPRVTGLLHAWLANSFMRSIVMMEGGDQVHAILTLFLIPITLADSRRSHFDAAKAPESDALAIFSTMGWIFIRIQMAVIYLQAATAKLAVAEWTDGSAIYYWAHHAQFGMSTMVEAVMGPVMRAAWSSALITWGTFLLEMFLFAALIGARRWQWFLLPIGIAFHLGIMLIHGLFTFALVMIGGLVLFLGPVSANFDRGAAQPTSR